ncbi:hypothetical protein ACQCVH_02435 [Bacillus infantis]|uniref:hypothetical protein n=1 Tax=Bacillus infantis TaxID=324767 RepID=UPI003CFB6DE0
MKIVYAAEASSLIEELPEFDLLLRTETNLKDTAGTIYLYDSAQDRETAVFLLKEGHLLEDQHFLISLEDAIIGEHFDDCGTISENGGYYLWLELVLPFAITVGDPTQREMALLQLEEHLAASSSPACGHVYFIGVHLKELASGIARAYDIEVSFLDLDKLGI